ncbi:MAG: thioredoxin [Clostridia bacterium]|nr:thioredoxin [Clostridia bacterium]
MKRSVRICIFSVLAVLGTAFLLYGAFAGQASSVLTKATRICLECIGIG